MPTQAKQFLFNEFSGGLTTAPLRAPVGTYKDESNVSTDVAGEVSQQPESLLSGEDVYFSDTAPKISSGETVYAFIDEGNLYWYRKVEDYDIVSSGKPFFVVEQLETRGTSFSSRYRRTSTKNITINGDPEPRCVYYSKVLDATVFSFDGYITVTKGILTGAIGNPDTKTTNRLLIEKGDNLAITGAFDADGRIYVYNDGTVGVPFVGELTKLESGQFAYRKLFEFPHDEQIVSHTIHGDYVHFYSVNQSKSFTFSGDDYTEREGLTSKVFYWNRARYISVGSDTATTYDNFANIEGEIVCVGHHKGAGWVITNQFGKYILGYISGQSFVPVRDIFAGLENYYNVRVGMHVMISFGNDLLFAIQHTVGRQGADYNDATINLTTTSTVFSYGNGILKKFRSLIYTKPDELLAPTISRFIVYSDSRNIYDLIALGHGEYGSVGDESIIVAINQKYNNGSVPKQSPPPRYSNGYIETPIISIENPAMTIVPKRMALHGYIRDIIAFDKRHPEFEGAIKVEFGVNERTDTLAPVSYTFKRGVDNLVAHKDDNLRLDTLDPTGLVHLFATRGTVTEQTDKTLVVPTVYDRFRCINEPNARDINLIFNQNGPDGNSEFYMTAKDAGLLTQFESKVASIMREDGTVQAFVPTLDSTTVVPYTINRQPLVTVKLGTYVAPDDTLFFPYHAYHFHLYSIPTPNNLYPLNRPIDVRDMFAGLPKDEQITSLFFRITLEQTDAFFNFDANQSALLRSFWFEYEEKEYL